VLERNESAGVQLCGADLMDYPEVHEMSNLKIGLLKTNVPPCQDGISKAAFSAVFRAHVLEVRYARTTGCGLAG